MMLSRAEALSILDKWRMESSPVSGSLTLSGVTVFFSGFITAVTPNMLKIAQSAGPQEPIELHLEIIIPLNLAEGYEYRDAREAPAETRSEVAKRVVSQLVIQLQHFGTCAIFERTI